MRYSKTNTTWFISRSKNYWSLGVGRVKLLPSVSRREVVRLTHPTPKDQ